MFTKLKNAIVAGAMVLSTAGVLAVSAVPSTASAGDRSSDVARSLTKQIYKGVGTRVCGRKCGSAAGVVGGKVFDGARSLSTRGGKRLQETGRKFRERIRNRHKSRSRNNNRSRRTR